MVKQLYEDYLPDLLGRFERRAATNNAPEGWIWGNKVVGGRDGIVHRKSILLLRELDKKHVIYSYHDIESI